MLEEHGESFDPCAERDTFDHSMMVNVESELDSQLEFIPDHISMLLWTLTSRKLIAS